MIALKVVIAGGSGVGKTTLVKAVSDLVPVTSEPGYPIAFDFGRRIISADLVAYLLGLPSQRRFSFLRDELCRGCHCALLLVDAGRVEDSFDSMDHVEALRVPYSVGINSFFGAPSLHSLEQVRDALSVPEDIAVFDLDVRDRGAIESALQDLAERSVDSVR